MSAPLVGTQQTTTDASYATRRTAPNRKTTEKLGEERCVGFMYMARINGINLYKHGISRTYSNLDDSRQFYKYRNSRFEKADFAVELAKLEASLEELGETLRSVYDEAYIARKEEALREAGIPLLPVEIVPQDRSIH
jgi:hypothetical protein